MQFHWILAELFDTTSPSAAEVLIAISDPKFGEQPTVTRHFEFLLQRIDEMCTDRPLQEHVGNVSVTSPRALTEADLSPGETLLKKPKPVQNYRMH